MRVGDDGIIAEIALRRGWIDREKLRRAVELQWTAVAADGDARLLDVLVAKGFLTEAKARELDALIALRTLAEPNRSRSIPGYAITRSLGQDGLGGAFAAVQISMDRPAVLKVLSPELAKDSSFLERFLREAKAVGRISHPNVVGGLDTGRSGEFCYYSVELAEGQDLRQALRGGPIPVPRVIDIGEQMVRALIHAAESGLVHRDIQPRQILVTPEGTARLCGLGQTRFPGDPSAADTGIPVGSPLYLSPELAAGSRAVDIRSDVYSLGATLYHLATGQPPLKAATVAELLRKHIGETPRPAVDLHPAMPRGLSDLLARMMAKSPADRCSSLDWLLRAFQAVSGKPERSMAAALPAIAPPLPDDPPGPGARPAAPEDREADVPLLAPAPAAPGLAGSRLVNVFLWLGIIVLAGGLVAACFWALGNRSGKPKPVAVEERPPGPEPPSPARAAPEPRPKAPEPVQDELARRLREAAARFDRDNPKAFGPLLLSWRRAVLAAGEGKASGGVKERLQAREKELADQAQAAFKELNEKVKTFRDRDQFGDALRAAAAIAPELLVGRWADRFYGPAINLQTEVEQRYLELATKGASELRAGQIAEGLRYYDGITALGVPWIARIGGELAAEAKAFAAGEQQRLDQTAKTRAAIERRKGFGQLANSFHAIQDQMKNRQFGKALELCREILAAQRKGEPGEAVARLEARLGMLAEVWDAVNVGPPAAIGRPFTIYGQRGVIEGFNRDVPDNCQLLVRVTTGDTEGKVHRQPIRGLPVAQLAQVAEWALAKQPPPARALKVALLYLGEEKGPEAKAKLEEARKLGADVAPYLDDLAADEAITKGLAAFAANQWAAARPLLESALDQYGSSFPSIVQHADLTQKLGQCLANLGVAGPALPSPAVPLPVTLRRFGLLPPCRLTTGRPLNPAAAYLGGPPERVSPALLGLSAWGDYTLTLRWTVESDQGCRLALMFRLMEPRPGAFTYYFVAADRDRLVLGRHGADRNDELAAKRYPELLRPGDHQVIVTAAGPNLSVALGENEPLQANDSTLTQGNIGLATSELRVAVGELSILLPTAWPRAEPKAPNP